MTDLFAGTGEMADALARGDDRIGFFEGTPGSPLRAMPLSRPPVGDISPS